MDALDGEACANGAFLGDVEEVAAGLHQQRTKALAAADGRMAHRFIDARALIVRNGEKLIELAINGIGHVRHGVMQAGRQGLRHGDQSTGKGVVLAAAPSGPLTICSIRACAASSLFWHWARSRSPSA